MRIAVWIAGFIVGCVIGAALGLGVASLIAGWLAATFCVGFYEGPGPAPGPGLSDSEYRCMQILRSQGVDATVSNRNEWQSRCEDVFRGNAMGNYIGYTEYTRRHPDRF